MAMMKRGVLVRCRLRASGEGGFTLIETIIAITIMFGSLLALAYTATAGFGYQDAARQRQTANGIANQLMEKVRGLSTTQLSAGLLSADLTDPLINTLVSPPLFVPVSGCSAGSPAGCGEKIISGTSQSAFPLNDHLWCTSTSKVVTINHIGYSCGTYVTQDPVVSNPPYRVTVIVTWSGGALGANKVVRIQSLFAWAPGCASSANHPYAGPCQSFFYVQATEPSANISITGTVGSTIISAGTGLLTPGATASEQTEQASSLSATVRTAGATMTGATPASAGNVTVNAAADDNPDTSTMIDSRQRCGTEVVCTGPTPGPSLSFAGGTVSMTVPSTTGESDSTTTAGASGVTSICPTTGTADVDKLPCVGATTTMASNLLAALTLSGTTPVLGGPITVANVATPSAATSVYVDRQFTSGYGCTSPAATIGCVGASATRSLGDITVGDLPASAYWSKRPAGWTGFLQITGYSDTLSASVGSGAAISVPSMAGSVKCWTGAYNTGGYTPAISLTNPAADLSTLLGCSYVEKVGSVSKAEIKMTVTSATAGSVTPTSATGTTTLTSALAQVVPPTVTVTYTIDFNGTSNDVALTITVNLGTAKIQGTYVAAPTGP